MLVYDAFSWGNFRDKQVTIAGTEYLPPSANEWPNLFNSMFHKYSIVGWVSYN